MKLRKNACCAKRGTTEIATDRDTKEAAVGDTSVFLFAVSYLLSLADCCAGTLVLTAKSVVQWNPSFRIKEHAKNQPITVLKEVTCACVHGDGFVYKNNNNNKKA